MGEQVKRKRENKIWDMRMSTKSWKLRYKKRDMSDVRTKHTLRNLGTYVIMVF